MKLILILSSIFGTINAFEDMTVVDYISRHGFTTLTAYLHKSGLFGTLSGPGPYTVFAATDAAFQQLDSATRATLDNDPARLLEVLEYSVVRQYIMTTIVRSSKDYHTLLHGKDLTIFKITGGVFVNNETELHSPIDVICFNGIVQTINAVLLPTDDTSPQLNIAQVFKKNETKVRDFSLFLSYYRRLHVLEGGEYTVFAPNDAAFGHLWKIIMNPGLPNITVNEVIDVCYYHVVNGARNISMLRDGESLYTHAGTVVTVKVTSDGRVMIDNAYVIEADIPASNGYIHVIDHLLVPVDVMNHINSQNGFHTNYSHPADQTPL